MTLSVAEDPAQPLRRRSLLRRVVAGSATALLVLMLCGLGTSFALLSGLFGDDASTYTLGCGGEPVDPSDPMPEIAELIEEQVRIAAIIINVGHDLAVPPRGW